MKTAKTKPPKSVSRFMLHESASASALILAVVLTSLLAIIGVMFIMIARVDKMATSAISENKELNFAVETVVAKISQELVLDVPGMPKGREYYDYPDTNNAWLASLEPSTDPNRWRQISDVTGYIEMIIPGVKVSWDTQDIEITNSATNLLKAIVEDHKKIELDNSGNLLDQLADADGDGVADSKWVKLDDITSNKGKPIYAAIRIIDNGGMLNVNTARQFDPNGTEKEIDGSSQTQINLLALSERGSTSNPLGKLDDARFGDEPLPHNLNDYIEDVVWRYDDPNGAYTPFDIGDELKLRNRYILNYNLMVSRIEELWENVYDVGPRTPIPTSAYPFNRWPNCTILGTVEPNDDYDYRHISTTYNMDRIIDPNGRKMLNVNDPTVSVSSLCSAIRAGLYDADPNFADVNNVAAQITANLIDYVDGPGYPTSDPRYDPCDNVTVVYDDANIPYYGFERPCVYISELTRRFKLPPPPASPPYFIEEIDMSYAIELYKPYTEDDYPEPNQWQLSIGGYSGSPIPVDWSGTRHFHVIYFEDPCCTSLTINFVCDDSNLSCLPTTIPNGKGTQVFWPGRTISLQRQVGPDWITVDSIIVPNITPSSLWLDFSDTPHSIQRDITPHKCIRRLWDSNLRDPNLGYSNSYIDPDSRLIQAHPEDKPFTNVGEIGMAFRKGAYYKDIADRDERIGYGTNKTETDVRLNLADPCYQNLFQHLTVFDPYNFHPGDPNYVNEKRIKGRININTAPWFVLAQLPWVSQRVGYNNTALAQAIVAYRDKLNLSLAGGPDYSGSTGRRNATGISNIREELGFESIGELNFVIGGSDDNYRIDYYQLVSGDLAGFPDLTPGNLIGDEAPDDFEERDVIFARISNLVTVRSDVFTAYILVRIGSDGPQKRVMAILDRSNVYSGDGKVRIIALHPVPDPR
jgi:hypothetical protein